jgi:hypothetical protein
MALSDTARRILTEAAQHPMRLASPPDKLPTAAARAVLNILLKQGYVEECEAPMEYVGLGWRRQDGAWAHDPGHRGWAARHRRCAGQRRSGRQRDADRHQKRGHRS